MTTAAQRPDSGRTDVHIAARRMVRRWSWTASIASIVVGALGLAFPEAKLTAVSLIVGIYFIVSGISRVSSAFDSDIPLSSRLIAGVPAALVVVVGVLCLNNPFQSLAALDVLVGWGLIVDAVACLAAAFLLTDGGTRRALIATGVVLGILGAVVLIVATDTLRTFLLLVAFCLLGIGVTGVLALLATSGLRASRRR